MSDTSTVIIPKELANAPEQVKKDYAKYLEIHEQIQDHKLRHYTYTDGNGNTHDVDCMNIWTNVFKRFDKQDGIKQKDYIEAKRRCLILHKCRIQKGVYSRKYNSYLNEKVGSKKVFEFRKGDILEAFGRYKSIDQVWELITEWGFRESRDKVNKFYYENLEDIQNRRLVFSASDKDFYLSTSAGRIEALSYLYTELLRLFEETKNVRYAAEVRSIIEQVRKEIKGDEIRLTVDGRIDITATLQVNRSLQDLNKKIPINMFIVGLVAAKKGLNQADIMSQLTSSFYSRFNGYNGNPNENDEIEYPSHFIKSYDWGHIDQLHTEKEEKAVKSVLNKKLEKFFKTEEINFTGNVMESVRELENKLNGNVSTEVIDVKPIKTTLGETETLIVNEKRELLKLLLSKRRKEEK